MQVLNAIILGIVQGLTEFLPISSSGHLVLYQHFFSKSAALGTDITLEVFLHLGSLFAVIIYFRREILELIQSLFHWKRTFDSSRHFRNRMVIFYLIISTVFTGVVYLLFGKEIVAVFARPLTVSLLLAVTGIIIYLSDLAKNTEIPMSGMGVIRSALIGLGQGFAMLPGISRSGTTIATSLFCGIRRADAARYSFLLSIPAILAANVGEFKSITELQPQFLLNYILGALAAFVSGYLVISFLIRLIKSAKLKYFAFYCWFVAAVSIALIVLR